MTIDSLISSVIGLIYYYHYLTLIVTDLFYYFLLSNQILFVLLYAPLHRDINMLLKGFR